MSENEAATGSRASAHASSQRATRRWRYGAVNAPIEDAINSEFTTLVDDYNLDTCGSS